MTLRHPSVVASFIGFAALASSAHLAAAGKITFDLDYSLDTNNFFNASTANGQAARATLAKAADVFADRLGDNLTAIANSNGNTWQPYAFKPATGAYEPVTGFNAIAANTLKIFVGGRVLGGSELGQGGPGGESTSYFQNADGTAFNNNVLSRGQSGALLASPTDFGPWGGSIAFDTASAWNFNADVLPTSGQSDFYSVCLHEMGHLLGFGTSDSFTKTYTTGLLFTGPKSKTLNGGANVPLANSGHLSGSLTSTVTGVDSQQPSMSPSITVGTRKRFTRLDFAGLDDLGWDLAKPGDANADLTVGFDDLLTLAQNYNTSGKTWSEGDFNYDGSVNFDDLLALAQNYNTSGPLALTELGGAGGSSFAADWALAQSLVPEPMVVGLLVPALFAGRRRRVMLS